MTYQQIRQAHPETWLLVEALNAYSRGRQRIVEDLAVVNVFDDSYLALVAYKNLQHTNPERELYVVHSSKPELDVKERSWLGLRSGA
jgi:hypothetical protein